MDFSLKNLPISIFILIPRNFENVCEQTQTVTKTHEFSRTTNANRERLDERKEIVIVTLFTRRCC